MESKAIQRLKMDQEKLAAAGEQGFYAEPSENTMLFWNGYIMGPTNTPYDGGKFDVTIRFPKNYPKNPPEVIFVSQILHPNIFHNGEICLEELEDDWNTEYSVLSILLLLQQFLREPDFTSPANPKATKLYRKDEEEYYKLIKQCIEKNKKIES